LFNQVIFPEITSGSADMSLTSFNIEIMNVNQASICCYVVYFWCSSII